MRESFFWTTRTNLSLVSCFNVAIIEQVRDGSSFRLMLLLENNGAKVYQFINASLSGIKAPTFRKDVPNMSDLIEPFSEEAKFFVESRLLHKNVKVLVESVTGQGAGITFFVTIQHPAGNISEVLLSEGLAKILEWNLGIVKNSKVYKDAEQSAKSKKLRIWKDLTKSADSTSKSNNFLATVVKIAGPDTLIVEPAGHPNKERKVTLSSVRGPKRQRNEQGLEVGYYTEAVEFLRRRLIGSKIIVKIDYIKPAEGEFESKECVTVLKNEKNIAELLVRNGLATVIKYRKDDHNRSSAYDSLLHAEEEAIKELKNIHSLKDLPTHRFVDFSMNGAKAKTHLTQLQRHESVKGVVEFVSSGSRFKIFLPSQNAKLTLVLGGVRTPKASGNNQKSESYGDEAAKFSSKKVFQKDVDIKIENVDKVGGFIGSIFIDGENLAVMLVEEGLATVHEYSASQTQFANQLFEAEETARGARKNIWLDYVEKEEEIVEVVSELELSEKKSLFEVLVSEIGINGTVFLQKIGPNLKQLESIMSQFSAFHNNAGQQVIAPFTPKVGEYCSGQFSEDKQWYRAKVLKVS
jgi:staphylococcal nuclease domain-containing protein 1